MIRRIALLCGLMLPLSLAGGCQLLARIDRDALNTGGSGGSGGTTGTATAGGGAAGTSTPAAGGTGGSAETTTAMTGGTGGTAPTGSTGGGTATTTADTGGTGGDTATTTTDTGGAGGQTATTTTGTGGTCDPAACPPPMSECKAAACIDGACGEENAPDGQPAPTQAAGNCKKNVCQAGAITAVDDDTDIEDDGKDCTADTCAAGVPQHTPLLAAACDDRGGAVCDSAGTGNCVDCNSDADCAGSPDGKSLCDISKACVKPYCMNGTQDGAETDIDCGGSECGKCAEAMTCAEDSDCQSNHCDAAVCAAASCSDGILNNDQLGETDIDCGGPECGKCADGKACNTGADCQSSSCAGGLCQAATCTDQIENGGEPDVDCGIVCPDQCQAGQSCDVPGDCASGLCDQALGQCVEKPLGAPCFLAAECASGHCVDNVCCDGACTGTCQACLAALKTGGPNGQCGPVAAGFDPDNDCPQQGVSTCGTTGTCDGAGACQLYAAGTQCKPAMCAFDADIIVNAYTCNGAGTCVDGGLTSCDPYGCSNAMCVPKWGGAPCMVNAACLSNLCIDGVCCNSACAGTCQACNIPGSAGTCINIPSGQDPSNECPGAQTCNGAGTCQ